MTEKMRTNYTEHWHAFGSFRNWVKIMWNNRDVDMKFMPRALFVLFVTFIASPLRFYESVRYGRTIRNTAIHPSPIFIVGHWRAGTTHLHNLMCKDKNLGYVSMFQTSAPGLCIVGEKTIKPPVAIFQKKRYPTRQIDNIPLSLDNPEEEDLAIANMSPYSYLHMYSFPRRAPSFFERYITNFDALPEKIRAEWTEIYLAIMRKATYICGGKRLVIKNCSDSARIKTLLDLFPDAKFIHTYRNPYDVFRSTRYLYKVVVNKSQLQKVSDDEMENWVLQFYTQLMSKFLPDRALIPAGNLVEIKYEDLDVAPIDQLRKIYETLNLPGFDEAEPTVRAYLDSIAGYKKNVYKEVDDDVITKVNTHWGFALDELGYERLEPKGMAKNATETLQKG